MLTGTAQFCLHVYELLRPRSRWVPTQADVEVLAAVASVDAKKYAHIARWQAHLKSFSAAEQKA
jgi:hypothetical protein